MPYRLQTTVLKPTHSGPDTWDWVSGDDLPLCPIIEEIEPDCFAAFEQVMMEADAEVEHTDELSGLIRDERGRVYRCTVYLSDSDRRNGLNDGDRDTYEMVWCEEITAGEVKAIEERLAND